MKILSVHFGHDATVALWKDGKIVFCQSEERLNRIKHFHGFPDLTLGLVQAVWGTDFDACVIPTTTLSAYLFWKNRQRPDATVVTDQFSLDRPIDLRFVSRYLFFKYLPQIAYPLWRIKERIGRFRLEHNRRLGAECLSYLSEKIGLPAEKILFMDHHEAHAYAALTVADQTRDMLVFTADDEGDGLSATVRQFQGGKSQVLCQIDRKHSFGHLYLELTGLLGMKVGEDEFKVMGLAPYAKEGSESVRRIYEKLQSLIRLTDDLTFEARIPMQTVQYYLFEHFSYERFDHLAAAIQTFLEDSICDWVTRWIEKTGIHSVAVGGGVFMNIKLNKKLALLPTVEQFFATPSSGDESLVIGALAYGHERLSAGGDEPIQPVELTHLYLGQAFPDEAINRCIHEEQYQGKFSAAVPDDMEDQIATLLADNKIVARFAGATEWGNRALGNRSILAHPGYRDNVKALNDMIKKRDFWMPFTPSILDTDADRYIINPKHLRAPYMAIGFPTTPLAAKDLAACLHPYDGTCRPQIVDPNWNPPYYRLITRFKEKTGIGGVLNTSFNLHREPIVRTPADALHVFLDSKLEYLAIGKYLLKKL